MGVGFITVYNTPLSAHYVQAMIDEFSFFICQRLRKLNLIWLLLDQTVDGVAQGQSRWISMRIQISNRCLIAVLRLTIMTQLQLRSCFFAPNLWPDNPVGFSYMLKDYSEQPTSATDKDFGIATHTDYGCLTLLATDGSLGLEVRKHGGS